MRFIHCMALRIILPAVVSPLRHETVLSFKNTVCLDPHAGVAADICLWNDNPIYGFSWMGCIRLTIPAWFVGFSVYYKHSYYFPIRRTDSKVDVGKLGIGFQIYLVESVF